MNITVVDVGLKEVNSRCTERAGVWDKYILVLVYLYINIYTFF